MRGWDSNLQINRRKHATFTMELFWALWQVALIMSLCMGTFYLTYRLTVLLKTLYNQFFDRTQTESVDEETPSDLLSGKSALGFAQYFRDRKIDVLGDEHARGPQMLYSRSLEGLAVMREEARGGLVVNSTGKPKPPKVVPLADLTGQHNVPH